MSRVIQKERRAHLIGDLRQVIPGMGDVDVRVHEAADYIAAPPRSVRRRAMGSRPIPLFLSTCTLGLYVPENRRALNGETRR